MKAIPQLPQESVEPLYDMARYAMSFSLVRTAIDLHVHDSFDEQRTAQDFSDEIHVDSELIEKFLNALTAIGLLEKNGFTYSNSPLASTYLVNNKPFFVGNILKLMYQSLTQRWDNLGQALKDGRFQTNSVGHSFDRDFTASVAQWALSGGLHRTVEIMAALPEFYNARRLLDIGGGHGLYAIAFSQENPELKSVVLDLAQVIENADKYIAQYEMQGRVSTLAGDYVTDDWGGMYDIIFASDVFFRAKEHMAPIVRKIRDSLNKGGVFVSKHQKMDETLTSPVQTVFHDLLLFLMRPFPPHTYTTEEFADLFREGGFDVETFDVAVPNSPSGIMICRKTES